MHEQTAQGEPRMGAFLNGFHCDPRTAADIITDPGGDDRFGMYHALEGRLYRAPEGHWFVVRALTPDEAEEWLERQGDEVMLRHQFPAEGQLTISLPTHEKGDAVQ